MQDRGAGNASQKVSDNLADTAIDRLRPLFAETLGNAYDGLPAALRELHFVAASDGATRTFAGRAEVLRGRGLLSRIVGATIGFPPAGRDVPVRVTMQRQADSELWTRDFAGRTFRSRLSPGGAPGCCIVRERFGPVVLYIALDTRRRGRIGYPVVAGSMLGIPLPRFLLPRSDTFEHVDAEGRACFDVAISLPIAGHIATYRGWLVPVGVVGGAISACPPEPF